ncbi:MAG: ATP-binding cassette domain-containing protein [Culicoidibacterales bacterium]
MKITDLTISYGNKNIIRHANLNFPPKTMTIITGPSGCGKSSLIAVLGLLHKPTQVKEYTIRGKEVNFSDDKINALIRQEQIGFVFQESHLLNNLTVFDNIALPLLLQKRKQSEIRASVLSILEQLEMTEYEKSYPFELSGGQKQRVCIARALILAPDIIIADEPTAALDLANTSNIMQIFEQIAKTKRVIIVSHDLELVKYANRQYEVRDKKVVLKSEQNQEENTEPDRKNGEKAAIFSFARKYRTKSKSQLNKWIFPLLALIIGFGGYVSTFGGNYIKNQQATVEFFSPDVMTVMKKDYNTGVTHEDVNRNFTLTELEQLRAIPGVQRVDEYHRLKTTGHIDPEFEKDSNRTLSFELMGQNSTINYSPNESKTGVSQLDIVGKLPEQNFSHIVLAGDSKADFIITARFLARYFPTIKREDSIGQELKFDILVPTKLFEISNKFPQGEVQGEVPYYKITTMTKKIGAVVDDRKIGLDILATTAGLVLFLPQSEIEEQIQKAASNNIDSTKEQFTEYSYQSQELQLKLTPEADSEMVTTQIQALSRNNEVIQESYTQKVLIKQFEDIRKIGQIAVALLGSIILAVFLVYYNMLLTSRKKEFGLLKVIGLSEDALLFVMIWEFSFHIIKIWVLSVIVQSLCNLFEPLLMQGGTFTFSYAYIIINLVIVGIFVLGPSIPIIWRAKKVDPTILIAKP